MTHYLGFWYFGGSFLSFWGCFLGFLNFQNHFWNLLKKLGRVYFPHLKKISTTRTSGAAGPLVLAPVEGVGALWAPCLCIFCLFFTSLSSLSFLSFFVFLSFFFCLFVFFVFLSFLSFFSCFSFFVLFCLFLSFFLLVVFLPFCHHYHNHGVNIYYHTNFCSNLTIFQFYHTFHHKPLPLLPPTPPHNVFCT